LAAVFVVGLVDDQQHMIGYAFRDLLEVSRGHLAAARWVGRAAEHHARPVGHRRDQPGGIVGASCVELDADRNRALDLHFDSKAWECRRRHHRVIAGAQCEGTEIVDELIAAAAEQDVCGGDAGAR